MRADDFDEQATQRFGVGYRHRRHGILVGAGESVPLEIEDPPVSGRARGGDRHPHSPLVVRIDGAGGESAAHEMVDGAAHRLIGHAARPCHLPLRHRLSRNRMQRNNACVGESPPAKPLFPRSLDEAGSGGQQSSGGPCLEIVASSIVQHAE